MALTSPYAGRLATVPPLAGLPQSSIARLAAVVDEVHLAAGTVVAPSTRQLLILAAGRFRLAAGQEVGAGAVLPGDGVEALTDGVVIVIGRRELHALLDTRPEIAARLSAHVVAQPTHPTSDAATPRSRRDATLAWVHSGIRTPDKGRELPRPLRFGLSAPVGRIAEHLGIAVVRVRHHPWKSAQGSMFSRVDLERDLDSW